MTRDDLPDGGAAQFAAAVAAVREAVPAATVEVLIPDLGGDEAALGAVLAARPDVLNHNLETVPRLYPQVRPQARYDRSLELLARAAAWARSAPATRRRSPALPARPLVKTGLMVGLGETDDEVAAVLADAAAAGVDAVTVGQYLQPRAGCLPVARYVSPEEFAGYRRRGEELGLTVVAAPFVRSSYKAGELLEPRRVSPALPLPTPQVVVFDLDYTLLRPSDQFEAPGYVRTGARFGLTLDPARWPQAERAAYKAVAARREETGLVHDDQLLPVIAHAIIQGLGGGPRGAVELATRAIIAAWSDAQNFGLYDDVLPCLDALRAAGVRMALLSNALGHGVEEIVAHFALDDYMAAAVSSLETGAVKPAPRMFSTLFGLLGISARDAVMVGDSVEDDVDGALACGCPAILLDRSGRRRDLAVPRIESLAELPAALGL